MSPFGRGIDVRRVIGEAAYARLPFHVRRRFDPGSNGPVTYLGVMSTVFASSAGKLLSYAGRLIGTPVVRRTGRNIPCAVTVSHALDGGTVWQRAYWFPDGREFSETIKRCAVDGAPCEAFNSLLAMDLRIAEVSGELHFISERYFIEAFDLKLYLPNWMNPGRLDVVHRDLGCGLFHFTMTLTHPLLGVLLYQDGTFSDPEELP